MIFDDEDCGLKVSINIKILDSEGQPNPSMVDLVVKYFISSHDQKGNIGHDIEHYEDNFE